ncbi:MAG: ABC transporter substrate-binding protein, partial [Thermoleophilaceae bacterium]
MRIQVIGVAVLLGLGTLATGCGGDDEGAGAGGEGPIKIGGIFDLSGPTSDVGVAYADGIKDRVAQVNEEGGVEGR